MVPVVDCLGLEKLISWISKAIFCEMCEMRARYFLLPSPTSPGTRQTERETTSVRDRERQSERKELAATLHPVQWPKTCRISFLEGGCFYHFMKYIYNLLQFLSLHRMLLPFCSAMQTSFYQQEHLHHWPQRSLYTPEIYASVKKDDVMIV